MIEFVIADLCLLFISSYTIVTHLTLHVFMSWLKKLCQALWLILACKLRHVL